MATQLFVSLIKCDLQLLFLFLESCHLRFHQFELSGAPKQDECVNLAARML